MTRTRICQLATLGLGAALLVLVPCAPACAQAPLFLSAPDLTPEQEAEVKKLYVEGQRAASAFQWVKAREAFAQAWEKKHHWQIAAALAQAEAKTGKFRDAAEHISFTLREAPPEALNDAERKEAEGLLKSVKARVISLHISVDPAGAEVVVNGVVVGRAPLPGMVFVDPGSVLVEARAEGFAVGRQEVKGAAGRDDGVTLVLKKKEAQGPQGALVPPPVTVLPEPRKSMNGQRIAGMVIGGVGVGALVAGAAMNFMALSKFADLEANCLTHHCPDEVSAGKTLSTASAIVMGAGVGAMATGAILFITGKNKHSAGKVDARMTLTVTPEASWLNMRFTF